MMEVDHKSEAKRIRGRIKHLLIRRKFDEALTLLSEALKYFPRCYKLYRLRAVTYSCLQEYNLGLKDAEMVIQIRPDSPDGYYQKGFCLYHQKDYLGAGSAFAAGLKCTPIDRVLLQAFWDAMTLISQTRSNLVPTTEQTDK